MKIKQPKTADEAELLIVEIAEAFGMKVIIVSHADLEDMKGTEGWSHEQSEEALEIIADTLGNHVGYAIDGAIEQIKLNNE